MKTFIYKLIAPCHRKVFNFYRSLIRILTDNTSSFEHKTKPLPSHMYIVTIAFNDEQLIRKQIQLIKQHTKDKDYKHIIVDNSTKTNKRELIKRVCQEEDIEYVSVPKYLHALSFPKLFWDGMSHGAALNWTFYHIINNNTLLIIT